MIRSLWTEHNEQDSSCPISQSVSVVRNHKQRIEENSQFHFAFHGKSVCLPHCRIQNKRQDMVIFRPFIISDGINTFCKCWLRSRLLKLSLPSMATLRAKS